MPAFVPVCLIAASLLLLFSLPALVQRKLHLGVVFPTAVSLRSFSTPVLPAPFPVFPRCMSAAPCLRLLSLSEPFLYLSVLCSCALAGAEPLRRQSGVTKPCLYWAAAFTPTV